MSNEDLMRYLDGELPPAEVARVRDALERSTELQRELHIFESLHRDIEQLADDVTLRGSVWAGVRRRLSRRTGWVLVVAGSVLWLAYGVWLYANSPANPVEKLAIGALGIGFLLLLGSVVAERLQEFRTDPYRDIER